MFADELERMMQGTPLSQIRVKDLCERCGVERRVFYYHFKDKYDLVAWVFDQDLRAASEGYEPFSREQLVGMNQRLLERRGFYRRAFEDDSQNSIARYLQDFDVLANEAVLRRHLGAKRLSASQRFVVRHYSFGNIGCTIDWLCGRFEATPEELGRYELECMPALLREAYDDVGKTFWQLME